MKHSINGWDIVEKLSGSVKINISRLNEVFGDNFDLYAISSGEYLLDSQEIAAVMDGLDMDDTLRNEFLMSIIAARTQNGCFYDVINLRQLHCASCSSCSNMIREANIEDLGGYEPFKSNFKDFLISRNTPQTVAALPQNACICLVNSEIFACQIDLPIGSSIVVDGENPSAPEELSLYCNTDGSMGMAALPEDAVAVKWQLPVLRLHIKGRLS